MAQEPFAAGSSFVGSRNLEANIICIIDKYTLYFIRLFYQLELHGIRESYIKSAKNTNLGQLCDASANSVEIHDE